MRSRESRRLRSLTVSLRTCVNRRRIIDQAYCRHTCPAALALCDFYFGCPPLRDGPRMFTGHLDEVQPLVDDFGYTPNNIWPADRSWLVYTDHDLSATRVSGSAELITALTTADGLDAVLCG
jgi:hypothetical protein